MNYDPDKVDEMVLALLWLTATPGARLGRIRPSCQRLHFGRKSKAKAVVLSEESGQRARELFERHFGRAGK